MVVMDWRKNFRGHLGEQGWSLQELANRSGVPRGTMEKWLRAENPAQPRIDKASMVADALGLTLDEVFRPTAAAGGRRLCTVADMKPLLARLAALETQVTDLRLARESAVAGQGQDRDEPPLRKRIRQSEARRKVYRGNP